MNAMESTLMELAKCEIVEELTDGMEYSQAVDRANNILQALLCMPVSEADIYRMISPHRGMIHGVITDPTAREKAAAKISEICETMDAIGRWAKTYA